MLNNFLLLVNFGWDTNDIEDRSFGSCSQNNVRCDCKPLRSCTWARKFIQSVTRLPQNHPNRKKVVRFIQDRSCGANVGTLDKVYCCEGRKGTFPIECKLRDIKNGQKKKVGNRPIPIVREQGTIQPGNRKVRQ